MEGNMSGFMRVDIGAARKQGALRQSAHQNNSTVRFFDDPNAENVLGMAAEIAFARFSGLCENVELCEHGDGLVDFSFEVGGKRLTIDVKAARTPTYLFLKSKDAARAADILVLARVDGDEVWFLGWEHKSMMLVSPQKDFGYGIVNHYRHYSQLRPMLQLKELIDQSRANQ